MQEMKSSHPNVMEFNEETAVGVLLHPESVLPYTLTVKVLSVESDNILCQLTEIETDEK